MDHPNPPVGHTFIGPAALMRMACSGVNLTPLGERLLAYAGSDPSVASADALLDVSTILQLSNSREIALSVQNEALKLKQLYHLPAPRGVAGIRLLALMTPGDLMTNTPLDFLLEDSDIALDILYVGHHLPFPDTLPDHDILFVAIGEADETRPLLQRLDVALEHWPRPILNQAEHITWLARDSAYQRLSHLPGVVMPATVRLSRQELQNLASGATKLGQHLPDDNFPLIIRPVGSHAGHGLEKLSHLNMLPGYLKRVQGDMFYLSSFIDYSDTDSSFRKYRIVLIEGKPYAAHMGISAHWMIHYMNAGMAESADKRIEEARFMTEFDNSFAVRHANAIQAIHQALQLDYLILDCAETRDGKLLLFEVDNSAVVHTMDPVDLFPYKRPQMRKVFNAFRTMLSHASTGDTP